MLPSSGKRDDLPDALADVEWLAADGARRFDHWLLERPLLGRLIARPDVAFGSDG
jgi:hypothetical protein